MEVDAPTMPPLTSMTSEELRHLIAKAAGVLAHRDGDIDTAVMLRRIADALVRPS